MNDARSELHVADTLQGDVVMTFDRSLSIVAAYLAIMFAASIVLGVF